MKETILAIFAAALVGSAVPALAEGGSHGTPKSAAVKKEQKPWGIAGDEKNVKRTITIAMTDNMRFTPDKIEVKQGDTIKLVMRNNGKMLHEMVIGTERDLKEHAALMVKFPKMEHDEPYIAHVRPGKTGQIVWTFNQPGSFNFACLIAGHYQAGMTGTIVVK